MKIAAIALSAGLLGLVSIGSAGAMPASSSALKTAATHEGQLHQVQYKKKRKAYRKGYRKGYRAGHRYRSGPPGWRSYNSRPYGWRTRGCVIVGPLWFCP